MAGIHFLFPLFSHRAWDLNVLAGTPAAILGPWEKSQENWKVFGPDILNYLLNQQQNCWPGLLVTWQKYALVCLIHCIVTCGQEWNSIPNSHHHTTLFPKRIWGDHQLLFIDRCISKATSTVYLPSGRYSINMYWMDSEEVKCSILTNIIFLQCLTHILFLNSSVHFYFFHLENFNGSHLQKTFTVGNVQLSSLVISG